MEIETSSSKIHFEVNNVSTRSEARQLMLQITDTDSS